MGRGRGKGKKQALIATNEDHGSGDDHKNPAQRRRGRPQKPSKNEAVEDQKEFILEKKEENGDEDVITSNERKRSRSTQAEENIDSLGEGNEGNTKTNMEKTIISGFRQIGSRRKNKPRRAAEVGVECN